MKQRAHEDKKCVLLNRVLGEASTQGQKWVPDIYGNKQFQQWHGQKGV